ncbi:hypothetical protein K461DRAFT_297962 [Myriangium duriaei CBS 260.36]|uniref:Uncharacterized protein n=1 Tax=Myriangium duriaei CBS 260.36 TaxID=1168546 RepID=A0A9P4MD54_9PEZI|nr:hypothetical protein K461DRAFT_297962 [Myriangium duriaei CBS 260.36]
MRLIEHESDFKIALDMKLVPEHLLWSEWVAIVDDIVDQIKNITADVDIRYRYGELRLGRINLFARYWPLFRGWQPYRGYYFPFTEYSQRFEPDHKRLLTLFAYATIVLSALQVGFRVPGLGQQDAFIEVAKWIMLLILGLTCIALLRIAAIFIIIVLDNARIAKKRYTSSWSNFIKAQVKKDV